MKRLIILAITGIAIHFTSAQDRVTSEPLFINLSDKPITITWLSPDIDGFESEESNLVIRLGVNTREKIQTVNFSINGVAISERGLSVVSKEEHNFDQLFEQDLILQEGTNLVKVTLVDEKDNVEFMERTIIFSGAVSKLFRTDYALLFATDEYSEWNNLVNPLNDARTIGRELEEAYGFKVELVENGTQNDVILKLREYAKKSYLEHDQLFIFFAGHGQFDELVGQGFIVTTDSKADDEAKTSYLSHSVLRGVIDNIPSQHTFLAMDVCFGGTFDPSIARSGNRGSDDIYDELSTDEFVMRKLRFKTRQYLTSGGKQYVPDGRPGMHSPFARKFLEALRDYGGRDKVLTLGELYTWLERINPEPKAGSFGTDEPGSDFVFVAQ